MKTLFLSLIATLCFGWCTAQNFTSVKDLQLTEDYENIHVHKLSTNEHASSFVIWVKQGVAPHRHAKHAESVLVLEGEGTMTVGEETQKIGPGDFINIPKNEVHSVTVTSKKPMKVISVQAPEFLGKDRIFVKKDEK